MSDKLSIYRNALNKVKQIEAKDALPATPTQAVVNSVLITGCMIVEATSDPISAGLSALAGMAAAAGFNLIVNNMNKK